VIDFEMLIYALFRAPWFPIPTVALSAENNTTKQRLSVPPDGRLAYQMKRAPHEPDPPRPLPVGHSCAASPRASHLPGAT